jgi:hypothetical protein
MSYKGEENTFNICLHKNITYMGMCLNICPFFNSLEIFFNVLWRKTYDLFGDGSRTDFEKVGHGYMNTVIIGTWRQWSLEPGDKW